MRTSTLLRRAAALAVGLSLALGAGASAAPKSNSNPDLKPDRLTAYVTTDQNQLISFNVRKPDQLLALFIFLAIKAPEKLIDLFVLRVEFAFIIHLIHKLGLKRKG